MTYTEIQSAVRYSLYSKCVFFYSVMTGIIFELCFE